MKRMCLVICIALTAATAACADSSVDNDADAFAEPAAVAPTHLAELRWNAGYVGTGQMQRGAYRLNWPAPMLLPPSYESLWSPPAPAVKTYGAAPSHYSSSPSHEAFAYVETGVPIVTHLSYDGGDWVVFNPDGSLFSYPIEEIEIHPATLDVYALTIVGNAIQLYRLERDASEGVAFARVMTYSTANAIFHNPRGNGYKSGAIAFVPGPSGSYRLAFMSESSVYAAKGLVVWMFDIINNALVAASPAEHRNYTTIPGAQTGKLNIAWDSESAGQLLYFARDNGVLYRFDLGQSNNAPPQTMSSTALPIVNDMAHWDNN